MACKILCTLSDYNYLVKGLALYESLLETTTDFSLYYLGVDDRTYNILKSLKLKKLIPLSLADIDVEPFRNNEKFKYDRWTDSYKSLWLASGIIDLFLLKNLIKSSENIMYIDSDMFFFNDISFIYNEIGDKDIGITPHISYKKGAFCGAYNMSPIYFKNSEPGIACLDSWLHCTKNFNNNTIETFRYQLHLELFEDLFPGKVHVIEAGQGAPWNFKLFKYDNKMVSFNEKTIPLVFVHFSGFKFNNQDEILNNNSIPEGFSSESIKELYTEYFLKLKNIQKHLL